MNEDFFYNNSNYYCNKTSTSTNTYSYDYLIKDFENEIIKKEKKEEDKIDLYLEDIFEPF